MPDRMAAAMRREQAWWDSCGVAAPFLLPTDLVGLVFRGVVHDPPDDKRPFGNGVTFLLRQEPAPGIHATLAQVPDLQEERAIPLHGATARLCIGGPNPVGRRMFIGGRTIPHLPMSRLLWTQRGVAYDLSGWGLAEDRLLRAAHALRPLPDPPTAAPPTDAV